MNLRSLIAKSNLSLAWRRITTGRNNLQYKRLLRPIYSAYEAGVEDNLSRLHDRLLGNWRATAPIRLYVPKGTGLQRAFSLLPVEDQIVLQAMANRFSERLAARRSRVELKVVFSNCLNTYDQSIFFLKDWHQTYEKYKARAEAHFDAGFEWVADLDLTAFYDTISHDLLLRRVSPRLGDSDGLSAMRQWMQHWTLGQGLDSVQHGIPQGPLGSDFLAECVLLPLDEEMLAAGDPYIRYVDDIKLFGETELEVQKLAARVETNLRELGLILNSQKFAIYKAESAEDLFDVLPSVGAPDAEPEPPVDPLSQRRAEDLFSSALSGRPAKIVDKTKARLVLYHAPPTPKLKRKILVLLERNPEHVDALSGYLQKFENGKDTARAAARILKQDTPYGYVRGELWGLLGRYADESQLDALIDNARKELRSSSRFAVSHRLGIWQFLLRCEEEGLTRISGRLRYESAWVQALAVPHLPESAYKSSNLIATLLKTESVIPGICVAQALAVRGEHHTDYRVRLSQIPVEVQHALRGLGVARRLRRERVDQIGELVADRYGVQPKRWRSVLGGDYSHALDLAREAENLYEGKPSQWLQLANGFNEVVFRALQRHLKFAGHAAAVTTVDKHGKQVKFGVTLNSTNVFSTTYPLIADAFRDGNDRRNRLPTAHPFEQTGGAPTQWLRRWEQAQLRVKFGAALNEVLVVTQRDLGL